MENLHDRALQWRIYLFVFDLRHFRERADAQKRLDSITDASYLGSPYFTDEQVTALKSTVLPDGRSLAQTVQDTLDERLSRRLKKRVESDDYRVCAAHDLAPIFEQAYDIKPKDLARNSKFVDLVEQHGLNVPDDWEAAFAKVNKCGPKPRPGKKKAR